jgi:hypothetical protein
LLALFCLANKFSHFTTNFSYGKKKQLTISASPIAAMHENIMVSEVKYCSCNNKPRKAIEK